MLSSVSKHYNAFDAINNSDAFYASLDDDDDRDAENGNDLGAVCIHNLLSC